MGSKRPYPFPFSRGKQKPQGGKPWGLQWQPKKDSNPHKQSQSLSCYLYTIRLDASLSSRWQDLLYPTRK